MGQQVLDHLGKFQPLPAEGILAGGAVHAALETLYAAGGAPVNDIDLFHRRGDTVNPCDDRYNETLVLYMPADLPNNEYGHVGRIEQEFRYRVLSTTRHGLLNEVHTDLGSASRVEHLLEGFDLNYARVAVDLCTGQLHWTREFERFWHGRQLQICRLSTPYHTLLRFVRKAAELPHCYADLEQAQLIASMSCWSLAGLHSASVAERVGSLNRCESDGYAVLQAWFGRKLHGAWLAQRQVHGACFELVESSQQPSRLWTLMPRADAPTELQRIAAAYGVACDVGSYLAVLPQLAYRYFERKSPSLLALWDRMAELVQVRAVPGGIVKAHVLERAGQPYLAKPATPRQLEQVCRFLSEHAGLMPHLALFNLSQQAVRIQLFRQLAKEHGRWVIGWLETLGRGSFEHRHLTQQATAQELGFAVGQAKARLSRRLIPDRLKLPLPAELDGYTLSELTNGVQLLEEGQALRHCVGGYADAVEAGLLRIVRLRGGRSRDTWFTAELAREDWQPISPSDRLQVVQLLGFGNSPAPDALWRSLQRLVARRLPRRLVRPPRGRFRWHGSATATALAAGEGDGEGTRHPIAMHRPHTSRRRSIKRVSTGRKVLMKSVESRRQIFRRIGMVLAAAAMCVPGALLQWSVEGRSDFDAFLGRACAIFCYAYALACLYRWLREDESIHASRFAKPSELPASTPEMIAAQAIAQARRAR